MHSLVSRRALAIHVIDLQSALPPTPEAGLTHGLVSHQRLVVALGIADRLLGVAPASRCGSYPFCSVVHAAGRVRWQAGRGKQWSVHRPAFSPLTAPAHLLHRRPTRVLMLQSSSLTCFSSSIQKSGRPEGGWACCVRRGPGRGVQCEVYCAPLLHSVAVQRLQPYTLPCCAAAKTFSTRQPKQHTEAAHPSQACSRQNTNQPMRQTA